MINDQKSAHAQNRSSIFGHTGHTEHLEHFSTKKAKSPPGNLKQTLIQRVPYRAKKNESCKNFQGEVKSRNDCFILVDFT